MANSEEDVMKMRLLVDGDGTGDDRRLNMMLKTLIKWCNAEEDQQTCEVYFKHPRGSEIMNDFAAYLSEDANSVG